MLANVADQLRGLDEVQGGNVTPVENGRNDVHRNWTEHDSIDRRARRQNVCRICEDGRPMLSCSLTGCRLCDLVAHGRSGAERERVYGETVCHALKDTINIAAEICGSSSCEGRKLQKLFDLIFDVKVRQYAGSLGLAVDVASTVKGPNPDYCTRQ
jgi:hypothetical protein